ncbi:membrane protein [Paenibacillus sp. CCS19]|uniref:permease n=1 Tax=Paenibacillus sp. CCS19 TaxID=3158387 RepID=UPI00256C86B9|nr:permease [Paenibacillus cellulosilyticus]GMK37377.1 membrane protein [Paenibacillus cellulosilyticus]
MTHQNYAAARRQNNSLKTILFITLFLLIAAAGLSYVKWWPYYNKALHAIADHTIGSSILTGKEDSAPSPSWHAAWDYAVTYYKAVWKAAILGILLGSLVQVLLPSGWLQRVLGKTSLRNSAIGGLASVPGMMCTCCAAPIAIGLHKKQVSPAASLAFWLGNPLINPATLIFMTFVLSWKFTVIRIVFGLIITLGVSYIAGRLMGNAKVSTVALEKSIPNEQQPEAPLWRRWIVSMWKMILNVVPAYFISVLVLGAARAWLFPSLGEGGISILLMVIIFSIAGALFVIPTAAEIPIIQSFLSLGFGGGPAAALLVVLPAVSLPSLLMIRSAFPARVVWFILASVIGLGLVSGIVGAIVL